MKHINLLTTIFLVTISFTLFSCGDDEDEPKLTPLEERTALLTNGSSKTWLLVSETTDGENTGEACQYDDKYIFSTEDAQVDIDPVTPCHEYDVSMSTVWAFNEDASMITIGTESTGLIEADIIELSTAKLVIEFERTDENGNSYPVRYIFEA